MPDDEATPDERTTEEVDRDNMGMIQELMSVGADLNSVQLKARLDALTDVIDDWFNGTLTFTLPNEDAKPSFADELNARYSRFLNQYLNDAAAQGR
jgi:hypothetical protein